MQRRRHTLVETRDLKTPQRRDAVPFSGGEFIVIDGPHSGLRERIRDGVMTVGRSEDNDVALTLDRGVSRHHAVVEWIDDRLYLRDLSSTNGTRVNGELVQGRIILTDLDVVAAGRSVLQVVFEDRHAGEVYELVDREETSEDLHG